MKLTVVGLGPGAGEDLTGRARRAIEEADLVVGYTAYIALIREEGLRRSGTDEEALLRAAQKRYQETKAYMEEKP